MEPRHHQRDRSAEEIRALGYTGGSTLVREYVRPWRTDTAAPRATRAKALSTRQLTGLLMRNPADLDADEVQQRQNAQKECVHLDRPAWCPTVASCIFVTDSTDPTDGSTRPYRTVVGEALPELDQRLSDELDRFNAAATEGVAPSRELTVQIVDNSGELAAGISGWTWGVAAGIGLTWVREDSRGYGLGARLLAEFEDEARTRGCTHVFVTSFTFQAPGFYARYGYREISRWEGVPEPGSADVHLRKEL